jgi:hypothetical protein
MGDRRTWAIVLLVVGSVVGLLGVWEAQAYSMKREFMRFMLGEGVENPPVLIQGKVWTEAELRRARVVRVPRSHGKSQALIRLLHIRDSGLPTNPRYSFQAVVADSSTGIKHVYGRLRDQPGVWRYDTIHPDSAALYIEQRDDEIQESQIPNRR